MHKKQNITHNYTKHYYAGSERILSKVGGGGLSDIDADPKGEYSAELAEKKDAVKTEYNMAWGCLETLNPVFGNYLTCIGEWSGNVYNVAQEQTCPFFTNLYEMKAVIAPEKDLYFYHSDHLGSASWITNANGQAIQHLLYLPFGETMVDQRTTSWSSRYSFSAKEKDEESGYSYFGARYYDSDISIWLSVDPMASKYPSLTPYNYYANNPLRLIDPYGMDIWNVDDNGKIINRITDKTQDVFRRIDSDGKPLEGEGNSITFEYGTVKERNHTVNTTDGEKTLKIFEVKGDKNASDAFDFLTGGNGSNKVEWGHVKIGTEDSGRNLLGTTNDESSSFMGSYALGYNYTIRGDNHNHPGGTSTPSESDVNVAKTISDKFKNATFNIYPKPNTPVPYNKNSDYIKPSYSGAKSGKLTLGKTW